MKNIVLYHKNCLDGTCAAWVASQYLKEADTTYIAVEYSKPLGHQMMFPPTIDQGQDIDLYILDWCPEMDDLDACCGLFGKVILIDHHESAIKKLRAHLPIKDIMAGITPANLEVFLADQNEWSGAMGTAIWFHNWEGHNPTYINSFTDHWLVKAVDDRDRWQFKLEYTKEINEGLFGWNAPLESWIGSEFNNTDRDNLILTGTVLLKKKQQDVQSIISSAAILDDNAEKIIFCNCPYFLASEVGNILAKDYRMAVLWFMDKEGQISVSLRSNAKTIGWINCAELAQSFNGGGHANAAGFKYTSTLEDMFDEIPYEVKILLEAENGPQN